MVNHNGASSADARLPPARGDITGIPLFCIKYVPVFRRPQAFCGLTVNEAEAPQKEGLAHQHSAAD